MEVEDRLNRHPGVVSAAVTTNVPTAGGAMQFQIRTEESASAPLESLPTAQMRVATPRFLDATGLALQSGRFFVDGDVANGEPVAVVSESLAQRLWPGQSAVGRMLTGCSPFGGMCNPETRVVGVVGDMRERGDAESPPLLYLPGTQAPFTGQDFLVRTEGEPLSFAAELREIVHGVNPDMPISNVNTLERLWGEALAPRRLTTALIGIFALVAFAVSLAGLAGVVAFAVGQRSREIGIRMALGADRAGVVKMVLRRGAALALGGLGVGVVTALVATRWLEEMLWGVTATDAATWIGVATLLLGVSIAACWIPALRATRIDPAVTFRGV